MTISRTFLFCILTCLSVGLFSCDEYCDQGTTTAMVVDFYNSGSGEAMSLTNYQMTGVNALVVDTLRLRQYAKFMLVPLSNASDTSRFVLRVGYARPDTLVVVSQRDPQLISAECGCAMFATIDTAYLTQPSDTIKEIQKLQPAVKVVSYREDTDHEKNLRILF